MINYLPQSDTLRYANLLDDMKAMQHQKYTGTVVQDNSGYQHRFSYQGKRITKTIHKSHIPNDSERRSRVNDIGMLTLAGFNRFDRQSMKCLELLDFMGVFKQDGILVGSHAYAAIGNNLGVSWQHTLSTDDIDISKDLMIANTQESIDVHRVLLQADFMEVPSLNHAHPSTTFRHSNKMKVDFLAPMTGKPDSKPKMLNGMGVYGEPLRFLDYLIKDPQKAIALTKYGTLALVPQAAKFAFHKCIIAQYRDNDAKRSKDLSQAENIMTVLNEMHPYLIQQAWKDLAWKKKAMTGVYAFQDASLIHDVKTLVEYTEYELR